LLRGFRGGRRLRAPPGPDHHAGRQHLVHPADDEYHPLHFDQEYAKASEFGRCIVCSPLTVALLVGMSVTDVSQKAIANLGWREIRMAAPLFAGDTLYGESEVLEMRESASRPTAGLVTVRTVGKNQDGKTVCTFERTILVAKRGHSVEDRIGY
jgi:acyl dehydratase